MVIDRRSYRKRKKSLIKKYLILIGIIVIGFTGYYSFSYLSTQYHNQQEKQAEIDKANAEKAAAAAKEAKRKQPVYITLPGAQRIQAIVDDYDQASSIWTLVSKARSISTDYIPANLIIPGVATREDKSDEERSIRADIEQPLKNLFDAAATASNQLLIGSGYRSASLQEFYFNSSVSAYGEYEANQSVARPGQSEHQLGLAVDISTVSRECYLEACFGDTTDGKWLENNAYKYGFILRYAEDKVDITGYQYEPWHFRYVGIELATALHESGLTLDEAWPYLQTALSTLRSNGAI